MTENQNNKELKKWAVELIIQIRLVETFWQGRKHSSQDSASSLSASDVRHG